MRLELRILDVRSLKEKRHVVRSLTTYLADTFAVAAAEVDHQDKWQRATIGVAAVGSSAGHVQRKLHTVRVAVATRAGVELLDYAVGHLERPE